MGDELVVRVGLKPGIDRDAFAAMITQWLSTSTVVDMVSVDVTEGIAEATRSVQAHNGLVLEETKRLYVRFGPRPDERVRLARQQFSMLSMIMNRPVVRGTKALLAELQRWDPETWADSDVGSATKVYSRLADAMAKTPSPLTRRKGVYAFSGIVPEDRRTRSR